MKTETGLGILLQVIQVIGIIFLAIYFGIIQINVSYLMYGFLGFIFLAYNIFSIILIYKGVNN